MFNCIVQKALELIAGTEPMPGSTSARVLQGRIWDVLAALRGPDSGDYLAMKHDLTSPIREWLTGVSASSMTALYPITMGASAPETFNGWSAISELSLEKGTELQKATEDADEDVDVLQARRIRRDNAQHFLSHIRVACNAIQDLVTWYALEVLRIEELQAQSVRDLEDKIAVVKSETCWQETAQDDLEELAAAVTA